MPNVCHDELLQFVNYEKQTNYEFSIKYYYKRLCLWIATLLEQLCTRHEPVLYIPFSKCMLFISASMVRAAVLNLLLPHTEKVTSTYAKLSKYIILSAFKRNLKRWTHSRATLHFSLSLIFFSLLFSQFRWDKILTYNLTRMQRAWHLRRAGCIHDRVQFIQSRNEISSA